MQYFGGKARIAKELSKELQSRLKKDQSFVDLFCGSCNVVSRIKANTRIANDLHKELIAMHKAVQSAWIPPCDVSEEEYKEAKKIVADYEFWNHPLNVEARKQSELNQFCDELEWSNSGLMDGMSVRLCNALKRLHIKVCDLTKKQFLSVKGNGLKSWIEFCEKTGKTV